MNKFKTIAGILVIFLLGAGIGALGMQIYVRRQFDQFMKGPPAFFAPRFMDRMSRKLSLSPEQRREIETITQNLQRDLSAFRLKHDPELETLLDGYNRQIREKLSPEQQKAFDDLRERWKGRLRHKPPGPPFSGDHGPRDGFRHAMRRMTGRLNLDPGQAEQIRPVMREHFRSLNALLESDEADMEDRISRLNRETEKRIKEILKPEQISLFEENRSGLFPDEPPEPDGPPPPR